MAHLSPPLSTHAARTLLGVGPGATAAEIRRAFGAAAKRAHPDRPGGSAEQFRQVTEAYRRLSRPDPDPLFQPPAAQPQSVAAVLTIGPREALAGGPVEHALDDGRRIRITLPPGLRSGDTVRAGAAELSVVVRGDGEIQVRGDDLWITATVAPRTLKDGGRVAVETPLGRRIVWVTRKAAERGLVRLAGQGLPARGPHAQGSLFVRLSAHKSTTNSAAQALLRRFAAAWAA